MYSKMLDVVLSEISKPIESMPTPLFDNPLKLLAKSVISWYNIEQISVNFRKCMHKCDSSDEWNACPNQQSTDNLFSYAYPITISEVYRSPLLNKISHCFCMASFSCPVQGSSLAERM